jgi:hypothetical protein
VVSAGVSFDTLDRVAFSDSSFSWSRFSAPGVDDAAYILESGKLVPTLFSFVSTDEIGDDASSPVLRL